MAVFRGVFPPSTQEQGAKWWFLEACFPLNSGTGRNRQLNPVLSNAAINGVVGSKLRNISNIPGVGHHFFLLLTIGRTVIMKFFGPEIQGRFGNSFAID